MKRIQIYSDGACSGNPGPGGWGALLRYGKTDKELSGGELATTNNRMELMGAFKALEALKSECEIDFYTDSQYVKNGIQTWIHKWKENNWKTSNRSPVQNKDLWQALEHEVLKHKINWHWLKGHAGHPENERCDELARAEISKIQELHSLEDLEQAMHSFKAQRD